ncbi:MAG: UDP-N-acetylglucosamine 2-epimerase (non-hydrolyzing) [Thermodesulfobacteriota bacterium]|nr:UDP-N-acetylglucosamine 2-epimerase (non-hydrolyzing) [Thermodesulfobacteriota bacterium]
MKIATIVGARPQFIKAAVVSRAIQISNKKKKKIQEILVHTGQHYDYLMDKVFFEELDLPQPHYHLGVGSGSHGKQTGIMLERIEAVLQKEKPGAVLVYGDTNSTLAGALAAAKLNIPVAHVEAGLRSYNRRMPEEINRLLTDHLSTFLFCPTTQAVQNLLKEGIRDGKGKIVKNVGDVMYDSILYYSKIVEKKSTILRDLGLFKLKTQNSKLKTHNYYLATLHRAENTDDPKRLKSILKALNEIGKEAPVILPLHPRTKKVMKIYNLSPDNHRVKLIEPVSYLNMLTLEKYARAILTDSGGVQKEAYWFGVPCITLRDETEWVETVKSGWNVLVGAETKRIIQGVHEAMREILPRKAPNAFGNGKASGKIVDFLIKIR